MLGKFCSATRGTYYMEWNQALNFKISKCSAYKYDLGSTDQIFILLWAKADDYLQFYNDVGSQ